MNFADITTYQRLRKEEEKSRLLTTLNASVHHEMMGPLKTNVHVAQRLIRKLKRAGQSKKLEEMAAVILLTSKQLLFHANDMLDQ